MNVYRLDFMESLEIRNINFLCKSYSFNKEKHLRFWTYYPIFTLNESKEFFNL